MSKYIYFLIVTIILLFYQTYIIQKDKNMRNYADLEPQFYARPPKPQYKKMNTTFDSKANKQIKAAKSPKKLSYVIPDFAHRQDKQNELINCRSNVNILLTDSKSLHKTHRKRTSSFFNISQVACQPKNYNVHVEDKQRIKSRWETTQYSQPLAYNTSQPVGNRPEIQNQITPKTGRLRQNMANYNSMNTMNTHQYNFQNFGEKKNNAATEQNYSRFGTDSSFKPQVKDLTSSKNLPLHERLKYYNNDPTFSSTTSSNQNQFLMSSTFSYSEYKEMGQPQVINKFMNSTIGGTKKPFYGNLDVYETKTSQQNQYNGSRISQFSNTLAINKILSNKSQITKQPELEDFIIGQCKGQGRFGKVYIAIHKKTGLLCALKKIRKQSVQYMIDQFIQELKIQLYLNHPKLVKIYGYFADKQHFYMLVEYMQQGSLYSLMKKNKKFQEQDAAEKLNQICQGIKQMHDQNIVHRDLKPENVVISNGVCKICDFGWAAICSDRRQTYCGTLDYVCPQIVEGNAYDSGADIWCIGVLAYELMCGKAPFYDISRQKTIQKIKSCKIDNFPPHLSKKAIKFIEMILKKDPDSRVGIQELLDSQFLRSARK